MSSFPRFYQYVRLGVRSEKNLTHSNLISSQQGYLQELAPRHEDKDWTQQGNATVALYTNICLLQGIPGVFVHVSDPTSAWLYCQTVWTKISELHLFLHLATY